MSQSVNPKINEWKAQKMNPNWIQFHMLNSWLKNFSSNYYSSENEPAYIVYMTSLDPPNVPPEQS